MTAFIGFVIGLGVMGCVVLLTCAVTRWIARGSK